MEQRIRKRIEEITGLDDFVIKLMKHYDHENWGHYYPRLMIIAVYTEHLDGTFMEEDEVVRVVCHEVAHHLQFHHVDGYEVEDGNEHDEVFKELFANLLEKYYDGNVPQVTLEEVKKEGLTYESTEKRVCWRKGNLSVHLPSMAKEDY